MLVGPGGPGGSTDGWVSCGGGAAGDVVLQTINLAAGTYPIVIGESPLPAIDPPVALGTSTTAFGLTARPGGRGAGNNVGATTYLSVEGGGGRGTTDPVQSSGASHTTDFRGGAGIDTGGPAASAGGGGRGAGGDGQDAVPGQAGHGGPGIISGIDGTLKEYGRGGGAGTRKRAGSVVTRTVRVARTEVSKAVSA